jgi:hypothetical protein
MKLNMYRCKTFFSMGDLLREVRDSCGPGCKVDAVQEQGGASGDVADGAVC